jgi:pro-sigmaK processing inhibitor BofA
MIDTIITVIIAILIAVVIWFFLKNITKLLINSVIGIVLLLAFNFFNILGMGDIPLSIGSVLVCAFGGLPGFVLLVILNVFGITI